MSKLRLDFTNKLKGKYPEIIIYCNKKGEGRLLKTQNPTHEIFNIIYR